MVGGGAACWCRSVTGGVGVRSDLLGPGKCMRQSARCARPRCRVQPLEIERGRRVAQRRPHGSCGTRVALGAEPQLSEPVVRRELTQAVPARVISSSRHRCRYATWNGSARREMTSPCTPIVAPTHRRPDRDLHRGGIGSGAPTTVRSATSPSVTRRLLSDRVARPSARLKIVGDPQRRRRNLFVSSAGIVAAGAGVRAVVRHAARHRHHRAPGRTICVRTRPTPPARSRRRSRSDHVRRTVVLRPQDNVDFHAELNAAVSRRSLIRNDDGRQHRLELGLCLGQLGRGSLSATIPPPATSRALRRSRNSAQRSATAQCRHRTHRPADRSGVATALEPLHLVDQLSAAARGKPPTAGVGARSRTSVEHVRSRIREVSLHPRSAMLHVGDRDDRRLGLPIEVAAPWHRVS